MAQRVKPKVSADPAQAWANLLKNAVPVSSSPDDSWDDYLVAPAYLKMERLQDEAEAEHMFESGKKAKVFHRPRLFCCEKKRAPEKSVKQLVDEVNDCDAAQMSDTYAINYLANIFFKKLERILKRSITTLLLLSRMLLAVHAVLLACIQRIINWYGELPKGIDSIGALLRQSPCPPLAPPV